MSIGGTLPPRFVVSWISSKLSKESGTTALKTHLYEPGTATNCNT